MLPIQEGVRTSHVLLSYPLGPRHWLTAFQGKTYTNALSSLIGDARSNILVVYGDQDEFTPSASYESWAQSLNASAEDGQGRLKVVKIDDGTHFWRGEDGERMKEVVSGWLP